MKPHHQYSTKSLRCFSVRIIVCLLFGLCAITSFTSFVKRGAKPSFISLDDILQLDATNNLEYASADASFDEGSLCIHNPFLKSLDVSPGTIFSKVKTWLSHATIIERELLRNGQSLDHSRFAAFEPFAKCDHTCLGGDCGSDQSKMVCGLNQLKAPCVVYSVGGNNMWEFELDVLSRTECEVHTFDCTGPISRFQVPQNSRLHFHHTCLVHSHSRGDDGAMEGERFTLGEITTKLSHERIDILKMDIEGFEWPILYEWPELLDVRTSQSTLPMQILLEIHYRTRMTDLSTHPRKDFKFASDMVTLQTHLLRMGYITTTFDPNEACRHCLEVTLLRVRCGDHRLESFRAKVNDDAHHCATLGIPKVDIPLTPQAFTWDRGTSSNYVMGSLDVDPPILLALPRFFSDRVDVTSGKFSRAGDSDTALKVAKLKDPKDGAFVDVGGWIGGSSFPSAALGFDTYVFEPVRFNTNLMHTSLQANSCFISEHLTIINAMASNFDGNSSVYVTGRADNTALTKEQATKIVGESDLDYEQEVQVVKLDSFFPSGSQVQYLKIDVQGSELKVLQGAERLLRENKGRIRVRFEAHEKLLKAGGSSVSEVVNFMVSLGFKQVSNSGGGDVDME